MWILKLSKIIILCFTNLKFYNRNTVPQKHGRLFLFLSQQSIAAIVGKFEMY